MGAQAACGDAHAIDEGAVAAAGVAHKEAVGIAIDERMGAGDFGTGDGKIAFRTAAQREGKMVDGDSARRITWLQP